MKAREQFIIISIIVIAVIVGVSFFWTSILWSLIIVAPLVVMGIYDTIQTKHTIRRNFPVLGRFRYALESIRPEIMQYFVETDTQGRPLNRIYRSLVYQRSKKVNDTTPFGTQMNVYRSGYEWMDHSMYATSVVTKEEDFP